MNYQPMNHPSHSPLRKGGRIFKCICLLTILIFIYKPCFSFQFIVKSVQTDKKVVALTFDDSPNIIYTEQILAILEKYQAKATFFMVGQNIQKAPDLARLIVEQGHDIGDHSFAHIDYSKVSLIEMINDIYENQLTFYRYLGQAPIYFRPPYGRVRKDGYYILTKYFYKIIKWSIDPRDWDPLSSLSFIKKRVYEGVKPGSIILFHDSNDRILELLPEFIINLRKQGYKLVTITDLLFNP